MTTSIDFVPVHSAEPAAATARAAALLTALRALGIELGEEVAVVGDGPETQLIAALARAAGAATVVCFSPQALGDAPTRSVDALVFASDDGRALAGALGVVRDLGRALLLGAVGAIDFDAYPDLHKRSIRLTAAPQPPRPSPEMVAYAEYLQQAGRLSDSG